MPSHPFLPAGFNADDNNGDEVDGAGTNWHVWPALFDAFEARHPLIVTEDMLDVFEEGCPDFVPPRMDNTETFPLAERVLDIPPKGWREIAALIADNSLTVSPQSHELTIRSDWDGEIPPAQSDLIKLPRDARPISVSSRDWWGIAAREENSVVAVRSPLPAKTVPSEWGSVAMPAPRGHVLIAGGPNTIEPRKPQ